MTTEKRDILLKEGDVSGEQNETITIDLKQIYSFDPKDISLDISGIHYSNLAYIQVTNTCCTDTILRIATSRK